jgi:hypothetical protein
VDRIAEQRGRGFEKIAELLGVQSDRTRLFLFADEESKKKETGHQGAGWAFDNNIVEVYNEKTKLDPYHETAHILSGQLGSPAALFNEGFAVYVSGFLGAGALRELGSPGKTCDQAAVERHANGDFITLERLLSFDDIGSETDPAFILSRGMFRGPLPRGPIRIEQVPRSVRDSLRWRSEGFRKRLRIFGDRSRTRVVIDPRRLSLSHYTIPPTPDWLSTTAADKTG